MLGGPMGALLLGSREILPMSSSRDLSLACSVSAGRAFVDRLSSAARACVQRAAAYETRGASLSAPRRSGPRLAVPRPCSQAPQRCEVFRHISAHHTGNRNSSGRDRMAFPSAYSGLKPRTSFSEFCRLAIFGRADAWQFSCTAGRGKRHAVRGRDPVRRGRLPQRSSPSRAF